MIFALNTRPRARQHRNAAAAVVFACLSILAWEAKACVANGDNLISTRSRVYSGFAAGEIIADWAEIGESTYLEGCTPDQTGSLTISAAEVSIGSQGGYSTYATSNPNIGMQVRYLYPERRGVNGSAIWSSWRGLTEAGETPTVVTHAGAHPYTEYVMVRIELRLIALNDISGDQRVERTQILQVTDESWGTSLHQKLFDAFDLWEPRAAKCEFITFPSKVTLPDAYSMKLHKEGALSDPATFTWRWSCKAGNLGHSGQGDFKYQALTSVADPNSGRMAVTGGAKGVDLLLTTTRGGSSGTYVPVRFDRWYGGSLGTSGTESLQVRYVRNADPDLVIGQANAGVRIVLEPL